VNWGCNHAQVIVNDAYSDERFDASTDILTAYATRSVMAVPIRDARGDAIGVLQVFPRWIACIVWRFSVNWGCNHAQALNRPGGFDEASVSIAEETAAAIAPNIARSLEPRRSPARQRSAKRAARRPTSPSNQVRYTLGPVCIESHCVCMVVLYTPGP
jgi:hypothetical protein